MIISNQVGYEPSDPEFVDLRISRLLSFWWQSTIPVQRFLKFISRGIVAHREIVRWEYYFIIGQTFRSLDPENQYHTISVALANGAFPSSHAV